MLERAIAKASLSV